MNCCANLNHTMRFNAIKLIIVATQMAKFATVQEVEYAYEHIAANSQRHGDCLIYGSADKYHNTKITHFGPGQHIRIYAHRLALLRKMKTIVIPAHLQASHLCHQKACINVDHIEAEPPHIPAFLFWPFWLSGLCVRLVCYLEI